MKRFIDSAYRAVAFGCLTCCYSTLMGNEAGGGSPLQIAPAETSRAELKEAEHLAKEAERIAKEQIAALTEAQLAERIVLEEKMLLARQRAHPSSAQPEAYSAEETAARNRLADELRGALTSDERAAIIARHRAFQRIMSKESARASATK
jgi:hypothetical protein